MVKVFQVMKDIERYEDIRGDLRRQIADRFNDDQIVEAKELIKNLDDVTRVLGDLYNLDVNTDDEHVTTGLSL